MNNNQNLRAMTECAVLLALSIVLDMVKVYEMPMGGSVTLVSMLPLLFAGVKNGWKYGLGTAFLYAMYQLIRGIAGGNVFVYCTTAAIVVICALFDYIVPFTVLGASAAVCTKDKARSTATILICFAVLIFIRFVCHFITGVVIWRQWAPEGMSKGLYSLLYNGQYMLPEMILTVLAAFLLLKMKPMRKMLNLK